MRTRHIAIALDVFVPYPHHQGVFKGVLRYAREHQWSWVIDQHPGYRGVKRIDRRNGYDGVIARADAVMQRRLKKAGVPLVNTLGSAHRDGVAGVYLDVKAMGPLAAEHLIARGHQRLYALIHDAPTPELETMHAFAQTAEDASVFSQIDRYPVIASEDPRGWAVLERMLFDWLVRVETPAAVLIDSSLMARMLVDLCPQAGVHVPQDLAVMTTLDQKLMMEVPKSISAIDFDYEDAGYRAAKLLDGLMDGEAVPDEPVRVPPIGIIGRASTDHFAVSDELVAQALRYISDNLSAKLTVEKIAYALAVSPSSLHNRLNAALGHGVAAEVRRLRVATARRLLADPALTVEDVAAQAGFNSADVMARVFRRDLGKTPRAFRRES